MTGAASGIGRAIAERLAAEQAHVVMTDVRADAVREAAAAIGRRAARTRSGCARWPPTPPAPPTPPPPSPRRCSASAGSTSWWPTPASSRPGPIDQLSEETWDRHFDVNVKGYFLAVREAVKVMKAQRRGVILLNASKGAFAPTVDNAAYASSKAAVAALCRNLAAELGPHGIRVNAFNADFVDTPHDARADRAAGGAQGHHRRRPGGGVPAPQPAGRRPHPAGAVAEAALFLVSPRSRFTTGAALPIDGGIKEAMPR